MVRKSYDRRYDLPPRPTDDDGRRTEAFFATATRRVEGGRGFGSQARPFCDKERYRDEEMGPCLPHKKLCMLSNAENKV